MPLRASRALGISPALFLSLISDNIRRTMTTERPSAGPPESDRRSDVPSGRASDLNLVRQTLPAMAPALLRAESVLGLSSGRSVAVVEGDGEDRIDIRGVGGELLLRVRMTPEGPVLSISGVSLEIGATKDLSLRAETVSVRASKDLSLEAGEHHRVKARDVDIQANPGAVNIKANDDVDIVGERVRLNSEDPPMPNSWEEYRARRAEQGHPFSDDMALSPLRPAPLENAEGSKSLGDFDPGSGGGD